MVVRLSKRPADGVLTQKATSSQSGSLRQPRGTSWLSGASPPYRPAGRLVGGRTAVRARKGGQLATTPHILSAPGDFHVVSSLHVVRKTGQTAPGVTDSEGRREPRPPTTDRLPFDGSSVHGGDSVGAGHPHLGT